jgi:hypothetical protein
MTATAYDRIIEALRDTVEQVKDNGRQALANCPAHPDQHPSLGVTRIEGSVLIKCRSQECHIDDILAALGLTSRDLWDEPAGATYTYTDLNGTPTRKVHRSPDKRFRQSGVIKGAAQLYRLPEVVAAVKAGTTIYLVEGEKDVHALEILGAVATTSPMGASNWHKVNPTPLTGAHVVIVPDRDQAGYKYATAAIKTLTPIAATVAIRLPATGKDPADHIAAGHNLDDLVPTDLPTIDDLIAAGHNLDGDEPAFRRIVLTPASAIKVRRVRWLWDGRIALGTLALLAGREGLGKSTLAYHLAAQVSVGTLEGEAQGEPRAVLIAASEDSWEHTIVPRLIAAGADLHRVFRIEVVTHDDMHISVSLPRDFTELDMIAAETKPGLMILDPLMSVIDAKLDTHRDRELRQALEPLTALADRTRMAIVGLIHHNKSGSTDALQLVMGSKAFAAVARSVHTCIIDPDDETQTRRLFATSKNNLGRLDLPILGFAITSHAVETEDDGTAWTGRLHWTGPVPGTMHEIMTRATDPERGATTEAADWLYDYLTSVGGETAKADVEKAARAAGHSSRTLARARERLRIEYRSWGFPRRTYWALPGAIDDHTEPENGDATSSKDQTPVVPMTDDVRGSPSRANYSGNMAQPPVVPTSPTSHATVVPTTAPLGTTGDDQGKRGNETPTQLSHARAPGGRHPFGTTGGLPTSPSPSRASRASRAKDPPPAPAPHTHAREATTCRDCGWPTNSNGCRCSS